MNKPLDISYENRMRIESQLNKCTAFRFVKTYPRFPRQTEELEQSLDAYLRSSADDVYAEDYAFPIGMEFFSVGNTLIMIYNMVVNKAMDAITTTHSLLDASYLDLMRQLHEKGIVSLSDDTAYHLLDLEEGYNKDSLHQALSQKFNTLNVSCDVFLSKSNGKREIYVTGAYSPKDNTIHIYPLSTLTTAPQRSVDNITSLYSVTLDLLLDLYAQTFLHEMVHALEPCEFERNAVMSEFGDSGGVQNSASRSQFKAYRSLAGHCTRFKLTLLYMLQHTEFEISRVRSDIFEDAINGILAESRLVYSPSQKVPSYLQSIYKLFNPRMFRVQKVMHSKEVDDRAYAWERKIYLKINDLKDIKRRRFVSRSEIRRTVEAEAEFRAFIRDQTKARSNYAKSESFLESVDTWQDEDFALTLNGEANLYLALKDGQDPFDLIMKMALRADVESLDKIPLDLVGIYIISSNKSYEIIYAQWGFDPVVISLEEAWWLLQ